MKGGFIVSPINPRVQSSELDYLVNYSEVKVAFCRTGIDRIGESVAPTIFQGQKLRLS